MNRIEEMTASELATYVEKNAEKDWGAISKNLNFTEEFIEKI